MIGSLNQYTKNLKMQTQFQLKQRSGDLLSHKTLEEWLGEDEAKEVGGGGDDTLRTIHQKLFASQKLTPEERRYLEAKDPETYAGLVADEREQKAFEQKLKQCRTKEEAQRLKMTHLSASLTTVKSVEHNSAIPLQKKLEIMIREKQRCDRIEASVRVFVASGEYEKLPTEAEQAKAQEQAKENQAETSRPAQGEQEKAAREELTTKEPAPLSHQEQTEATTPEQRKVKRAKAKAAAAVYQSSEAAEMPGLPALNIRA